KILVGSETELTEEEMIPIIQILDNNAKGGGKQNPNVEGVASTNITQPTWYKVFRSLQKDSSMKERVDALFKAANEDDQIRCLDKIHEQNTVSKIIALTGNHGTV